MFTGLVEEIGRISDISGTSELSEISIEAPLVGTDLAVGDSVAVNGVCLTVIAVNPGGFTAQAVAETLRKSNLARAQRGRRVNLERALLPTTRLGGHIVQGHVDCVGRLTERIQRAGGQELIFELPPEFIRFAVPTGSITVDGVSLTIAGSWSSQVKIAIVPHTAAHTTLGELRVGGTVNLELDVLAKYTAHLLEHKPGAGRDHAAE